MMWRGQRPFSKNPWIDVELLAVMRKAPSEHRPSGNDLPCVTWDPYKREAFLSAPDHPGGVSLDP